MRLSLGPSRVVMAGFDPCAALFSFATLVHGCYLSAWFLLAAVVLPLGFRYCLVVDAHGGRLWRTWVGLPWSRRRLGRRPRVTVVLGWDADEL